MKIITIYTILFITIGFFVSCTPPVVQESKPSLRIIIFADKTNSILTNSIPMLEKKELSRILEYIKANGGEMALSNITNISKENLVTLRKISKPNQVQGESAEEFSVRAREWKSNSQPFAIEGFLNSTKVQNILDYSKLYNSTNIPDAVDLANLYLTSKNVFWESSCRNIALFITDGENNVVKKFPSNFCCELYMVTRSTNTAEMKPYNPILHPTVQSAVDEILNK